MNLSLVTSWFTRPVTWPLIWRHNNMRRQCKERNNQNLQGNPFSCIAFIRLSSLWNVEIQGLRVISIKFCFCLVHLLLSLSWVVHFLLKVYVNPSLLVILLFYWLVKSDNRVCILCRICNKAKHGFFTYCRDVLFAWDEWDGQRQGWSGVRFSYIL